MYIHTHTHTPDILEVADALQSHEDALEPIRNLHSRCMQRLATRLHTCQVEGVSAKACPPPAHKPGFCRLPARTTCFPALMYSKLKPTVSCTDELEADWLHPQAAQNHDVHAYSNSASVILRKDCHKYTHLLEVGELRDLHTIQPHLPAKTPSPYASSEHTWNLPVNMRLALLFELQQAVAQDAQWLAPFACLI
eukprot:1161244-Pelagomonas_calceolata.AAC.7